MGPAVGYAARVQAGVPRAVVQSRGPAVPQGLCAGTGPLPPARLSTQPARGAAGGRSPPGRAGQGPAAAQRLLRVSTPTCHSLQFHFWWGLFQSQAISGLT